MITILSIATNLGAAAATISMLSAAAYGANSLRAFSLWAAGPYLGFSALTLR